MSISGVIIFVVSAIFGYFLFLYLSHPNKKKHLLPKIGFKNVELLPNFRIHLGNKTYHVHHWFGLALIILIPFFLIDDFSYPMVFKGIIVGGIIQGLRYPNKFKFRYPRVPKFEDWEKIFLPPQSLKKSKAKKKK